MGFKYLVLIEGKVYLIENQDDEMLGLLVFFNILCAKMVFSLLLRLRMLNKFVPGCTGRIRQIGLIVVTIKLFSFMLQQPILDWMGLTCCI